MKPIILLLSLFMLSFFAGCNSTAKVPPAVEVASVEETFSAPVNSVYFWKTVFKLNSAELTFLRQHNVGRIYLRMFDVVPGEVERGANAVVPNASVTMNNYIFQTDQMKVLEFTPVVYITLDALKAMKNAEETLARNIVTRVKNMCSYYGIPNVGELQLDCDWTTTTEASFFELCKWVKSHIDEECLDWRLSSTIRLHQLARTPPPVDCGVLMVYNTGSFDNPDSSNSILDPYDVEPYLKYLRRYRIPLDIALPTYSWQLRFHNRKFCGLTDGLELADSTRFAQRTHNTFEALNDIPHRNTIIRRGDIIRHEDSQYSHIMDVKNAIEKRMNGRQHSVILYHLDASNLSKYTTNEISSMYSTHP